MALLEFGTVAGLAYQHDFNADISNLYKQEAALNNAKSLAAERVKRMTDGIEFGKGSTPWFTREINKFSNGIIDEIGKMDAENPDIMYNEEKWLKRKALVNQLKTNELTVRSDAAQKQYDALSKYGLETEGAIYDKRYTDQVEQWKKFSEQGHVELPDGSKSDFVFINPKDTIDFDKKISEIANGLNVSLRTEGIGNGMIGIYGDYSPELIANGVATLMSDSAFASKAEEKYNELDPHLRSMLYDNVNDFVYKQIESNRSTKPIGMYTPGYGYQNKADIDLAKQIALLNAKNNLNKQGYNQLKDLATETKAKTNYGNTSSPGESAQINEENLQRMVGADRTSNNNKYILSGDYLVGQHGQGPLISGRTIKSLGYEASVNKTMKHYPKLKTNDLSLVQKLHSSKPGTPEYDKMYKDVYEDVYYLDGTMEIPYDQFEQVMGVKAYDPNTPQVNLFTPTFIDGTNVISSIKTELSGTKRGYRAAMVDIGGGKMKPMIIVPFIKPVDTQTDAANNAYAVGLGIDAKLVYNSNAQQQNAGTGKKYKTPDGGVWSQEELEAAGWDVSKLEEVQ